MEYLVNVRVLMDWPIFIPARAIKKIYDPWQFFPFLFLFLFFFSSHVENQ